MTVELKNILLLVLPLFILSAFATSSSANNLSLVVGAEPNELRIVPSTLVSGSPGSKPGFNIFAERIHIHGLSRMKNLNRFSYAVSVKVSHLNSSLHLPNVEICFHRDTSLGVGMCPQGQWQKLSKGSWSQKMSPFDHKLLDVRTAGSSLEALTLTLEEEFSTYHTVLVLGMLLVTLAVTLSESLIFYYSSAMAVGIILLILVVLFQGMKLLPTGRGNSLAIFVYSSLCSLDPLLAAEALVTAICVSSILRKAARPRLLRRLFRKLWKAGGGVIQKSSDYDSSPTYVTRLEHANNCQISQMELRSPPSKLTSRPSAYSSIKDLAKKKSHSLSPFILLTIKPQKGGNYLRMTGSP